MKNKIESLTPEQEKLLPEFREQWRSVGLNTESIDRKRAEIAVKNLYRVAGEEEPMILFFDSPVSCLLARAILQKAELFSSADQLRDQLEDQLRDQLEDQLRGQLWGQLRDQLWGQLWGQLWDQLRGQLRGQLWGQLWDQLRDQLGDQLGGQLGGQLRDQLEDQLRDQLEDQLRDQLGGQLWDQLRGQLGGQLEDQLGEIHDDLWFVGGWDSFWLAFYKFGQEIGATYHNQEHFDVYINYAKDCGVMYPYKGVAFVSDRAEILNFDDRRLLHCENDYAMKFRDGYGFCAWHGVRVPDEWIVDKKLDAKTAITWNNMEQRRAACEIVGWHNVLTQLNAKTVDKHANPFVGELLEVDLPDIGREKFLKVCCGTKREFALPVPPQMKRASEAQAWLNFTTEDMYLPQVRT